MNSLITPNWQAHISEHAVPWADCADKVAG